MSEESTMVGAICPECGKGRLFAITRAEEFDFDLGEETVHVRIENYPLHQCDQCGQELSGKAAMKIQHDAICRAAGFYMPAEIREM